jgi:solute carrier family 8 (sodium/calcium exchanger)
MTFKCKFSGLVLPLFGDAEMDWPNPLRVILYLMGLGWIFLAVGLVSDVFMTGIEKVTSSKKRVLNKETGKTVTVYVWNDTVANLTLMALGSSAPEILLSLIEITSDEFFLGPLGAGTIVGSAAFNLLVISAVCVASIPDGEVRKVKQVPVYMVTSTFSVFAYLWLMFILMVTSPDICEIWEATLTLLFCPILVVLAYIADRGYFDFMVPGGKTDGEQNEPRRAIADDCTEEELKEIEAEIRAQYGADLTSDQVVKLMQAQFFNKHSRAFYRHTAMQAQLHGKADVSKVPVNTVEAVIGAGPEDSKKCTVGWVTEKCAFPENVGKADVYLMREGYTDCKVVVMYATREGTAKEGDDFTAGAGTIVFEKGCCHQVCSIPIKDDVKFENDEEFYIDLSNAQGEDGAKVSISRPTATVVIIDDDLPGCLRFRKEVEEVTENDAGEKVMDIIVDRFNGQSGAISCSYKADTMGAQEGIDYVLHKGTLEFKEGERFSTISVKIPSTGRSQKASFNVVLEDPVGTTFDDKTDGGEDSCICHITIKGKGGNSEDLLSNMKARVVSGNQLGNANWAAQFKDALFQVGEDEEEDDGEGGGGGGPSKMDYFIHILSVPWKLLFAFVPPPDYCGGWACFCGALVMIAVVTAIVGDMANLVGCCFDILPETAAITFVALGTSLPDTFASKAAAVMDPYADASIGNVTGSNSINVFMGIGLSWCLAAFKWQTGDIEEAWVTRNFGPDSTLTESQKTNIRDFVGTSGKGAFVTPAGTIWFNLMVFSVNAFCAIQHLYARRRKFGGELGGPKKGFFGQYFSAAFLLAQWFVYVVASIVFARMGDAALSYGQITD